MISVFVSVNGRPIMGRSAVNQGATQPAGYCQYLVDDGSTLVHNPDDGEVNLAIAMLKTIKELGVTSPLQPEGK